MGPELYQLFGFANPLLFIFLFLLWRWWHQRYKEDFFLALFFLCLYISMAFSVLADTLHQPLNIVVFLSKIFLCLAVFLLFLFLLIHFVQMRKYRSFIAIHMLFVIFIGLVYLPWLATPSTYTGTGNQLQCYNQNPAFSIALLSYIIFWNVVVIYYLYQSSLIVEKLSSRVKLHLFILGVLFTFIGILCIECGYLDTRDMFILEFTGKIYGIVFYTIAFVLFVTSLFVPRSLIRLWEEEHVLSYNVSKSLKNRRSLLIAVVGILLNVVGGKMTSYFHLPFFADMIGTAMVAFTLGPWHAATVGLLTNFLLSVFAGVAYFPFSVCNIAGGLLWGYLARLGYDRIVGVSAEIFWRRFLKFIVFNGVLVGITIAAIATIISLLMFGGFSGHGAEFIALQTQRYIGSEAGNFLARVGIESFDKSCAALIALYVSLFLFQRESAEFLKYGRRKLSVRVGHNEVILFLFALVFLGLCSVPLFFHVLVLPETAIVTPYTWVLLNFVWISVITALGLAVLYRWTE
ncbi:MAG: hypothetical protein N3F63_01060 [Thermoplasmata archaeon]|nr:hypothetical protein [Thermoplasmata archaeon]